MTKEHLETGPSSIRDDSICESSLNPNKSSGDIGERLRNPVEAWVDTKPRDDLDLSAFIEWIKGECGTAAAEIERLRRERYNLIADLADMKSRALTAESAVAAAWEEAAKIAEHPRFSNLTRVGVFKGPNWTDETGMAELMNSHARQIASAIRAAVSKKTAES